MKLKSSKWNKTGLSWNVMVVYIPKLKDMSYLFCNMVACCTNETRKGGIFTAARINLARKTFHLLLWPRTPNSWEKETSSMTILENYILVVDIASNDERDKTLFTLLALSYVCSCDRYIYSVHIYSVSRSVY